MSVKLNLFNKMIKTSEEILADIDATLDQLIENAAAIKCVSASALFQSEVDALQKTQESLLARLVHMNELLNTRSQPSMEKDQEFQTIEQKIVRFGKLNAQMIDNISSRFKRTRRNQQLRIRRRLKIRKRADSIL